MGKDRRSKVVTSVKFKKESKEDSVNEGSGTESGKGVGSSQAGFESNVNAVRSLFLRSLALIYFFAFASVYLQIEGLYGTNGVTPLKAELKLQSRSPNACFQDKKSILCFIPQLLGISSQHAMDVAALVGILLSSVGFLCVHCCIAPVLAALWILYFSIYSVGNVFLWFQWDILLLEAGVLGILAAPWFPTNKALESKPRDLISLWMVKWLLFRLMFASGVVKLTSGCPTWWGLTALNYHFETQCLPTPLAYYAHQLPSWLLKLGVVGTYYIEILVPFAFFAPFAILKRFSFWLQVIFQLSIIVSGNYSFFNLLTIVLCFSLLDGDCLKRAKKTESKGFSPSRIFIRTFCFTLIGLSLYYTWKYFGLDLDGNKVTSKINFKNVEFNWFVSMAVPYSIALGFLTLVSTILHTVVISIIDVNGGWNKIKSILSVVLYGFLCVALFSISLVPFSSLHKETNQALPEQVREAYSKVNEYHLTSSYGLFRRMTGTDGGRPEVILEYSDNLNGPWSEYQFLYKPGNVTAAPRFIVPHQPRLDWQMWFAALSTYHDTPWLVSLSYRLLQGEPSVKNLLDIEKFPSPTPKYIRATLYRYRFTSLTEKAPQDWWKRKKEKEFLPVYSVSHAPLVDFLKKLNYLQPDIATKGELGATTTRILDFIRAHVQVYRPEYFIWAALLALLSILFTSKIF